MAGAQLDGDTGLFRGGDVHIARGPARIYGDFADVSRALGREHQEGSLAQLLSLWLPDGIWHRIKLCLGMAISMLLVWRLSIFDLRIGPHSHLVFISKVRSLITSFCLALWGWRFADRFDGATGDGRSNVVPAIHGDYCLGDNLYAMLGRFLNNDITGPLCLWSGYPYC